MIWVVVLVAIAVLGLLALKHGGGYITEEPIVTATYMVWPLSIVLIAILILKDARKEAEDLQAELLPEARAVKPPLSKDLN
jgi:Mn2+/Fe2+ NRAMP family transporter